MLRENDELALLIVKIDKNFVLAGRGGGVIAQPV
jgi:hypothetical protein